MSHIGRARALIVPGSSEGYFPVFVSEGNQTISRINQKVVRYHKYRYLIPLSPRSQKSYTDFSARHTSAITHGDIGFVCGVCVYGLGVLCAQPSQVGDAHVRHGRGLARRGKLQPIHIST